MQEEYSLSLPHPVLQFNLSTLCREREREMWETAAEGTIRDQGSQGRSYQAQSGNYVTT